MSDNSFASQHISDVIYGRKYGTALTLDVFIPPQPNGAGVIYLDSGGYLSDHANVNDWSCQEYLRRGYTVFFVIHGSAPKYTVLECIADVSRAVRFVRCQAGRFGIDGDRLGITGSSAGGHLSLVMALCDGQGDSQADDPVDRLSRQVQAAAVFCPPSDFLNYWGMGKPRLGSGDRTILGPYAFTTPGIIPHNEVGARQPILTVITQTDRINAIGHDISPVNFVSPRSSPVMIIHGDADTAVPIEQSCRLVETLKAAGVEHKLLVLPGEPHRISDAHAKTALLADWFDRHLCKRG